MAVMFNERQDKVLLLFIVNKVVIRLVIPDHGLDVLYIEGDCEE
jgi:hypothetical protein